MRRLHPLTRHSAVVFHGERSHDQPISDNTLRATVHMRLAKEMGIDPLAIEAQLAYAVKDSNGRASNRTQYLKHRTGMMRA